MARRAALDNVVKLTRSALSNLALNPGQAERIWWDSEVAGLGYRLRGSRATWVIRPPRDGGRSFLVTLGPAGVLEIAEARKAAREHLAQVALRQTPSLGRRHKPESPSITVGETFARYVADAKKRMRPSTFANLLTHQRLHFASLHPRPLTDVTRRDVATTIRAIADSSGPQAALRARRTLSTFYGWCVGEGLAENNPVVGTNAPAQEVRRKRVLSETELVTVWQGCPAVDDFNRIMRLLILTGQRRKEIAGICWAEIDFNGAVLRLPADRTKNKRPHDVHLSRGALQILASAPRVGDRPLVFGSGNGPFSGFSKSKKRLDAELGIAEAWRIYDLRRTVATGMAEIGVLPHIVEAALNHVSGHKAGVAGIYNRASYVNEKREALDRWSAHVEILSQLPEG